MAPSPKPRRRDDRDRDRRRERHSRHISSDALLPEDRDAARDRDRKRRRRSERSYEPPSSNGTLSAAALAQLNATNEEEPFWGAPRAKDETPEYRHRDDLRRPERTRHREHRETKDQQRDDGREPRHRVEKTEYRQKRDRSDYDRPKEKHRDKQRRVVSGPLAEEGGVHREHRRTEYYDEKSPKKRRGVPSGDEDDRARKKKKRRLCFIIIGIIALLIIIIVVAVEVSKNNSSSSSSSDSTTSDGDPSNTNLKNIKPSSIPASAQGTYLDPFTWYDTQDFNVTYTNETVGGLPVMGLFTNYDNSVRANSDVPAISGTWDYQGGKQKIHGMNVGGWLSLEPFITPSLFNQFNSNDGVIDEWTLTSALGPDEAASQLEKHYSSFITAQTFNDIKSAGFDHVRIPYSYWAVTTYDGDPYVPKISWRYLLRGIEYCRQNGLRVNLDLHGLPGSQNGWNHSGRQGPIGWLNGTDGALNAQRSIDIHTQLATFFSQPRYNGLVTMYGLANEPKMVSLNTQDVVTWSQNAISAIHSAGLSKDVIIVIGDGFLGLANWQGSALSASNVLLDAHQYVIFNVAQIVLSHSDKINFACNGWTQQSQQSMSTSTGFGSFLCGEWSQADTDCQDYLNNVGWGNRWEGTYDTGNFSTSVMSPTCPTASENGANVCSCASANADPSDYSNTYKQWLLMFAEAQMHSYEVGWGWFYWTWKTETATQWSYQLGMQAGILPKDVTSRDFDCSQDVPDFSELGLAENY